MIYEKIRADLKTAMKNKAPITGYIKLVVSELDRISKNVKSSDLENGHLTDDNCLKELKKLYNNSLEMNELGEAKYLSQYIPKQLSETEIRNEMADYMNTLDVHDLNIGTIMKYFNMNYRGKVDNKLVSQIANEFLN